MSVELVQANAIEELARRPVRFVDMIYSDPPFNTGVRWTGAAGSFDDRWSESPLARAGWEALAAHNSDGAALLHVAAQGDEGLHAYLGMMAGLLLACRRALKLTGTLWLHFDDTAGAHLRILLDVIFTRRCALGTLVWKRSEGRANTKGFARTHDTIAVYARTDAARHRLSRLGWGGFDPLDASTWTAFADIVNLSQRLLGATDAERVGYPTQKPVALISEFISAATTPGDLVCDPTMGSGTTIVAATRLNRRGLGIDLSPAAIATARKRLDKPQQLSLLGDAA